MSMSHQQIHAKALAVAGRYQSSVSEVIDVLQELDEGKTFRVYECSSLYSYAIQHLKLSEDTAVSYIAIARKSVEVPALKQQLKCGAISTSKARKIVSVLSVENQEDWLVLARSLTLKNLEREVAQDLVSNSQQSAASFEQTLEAALEMFLERRDPLRRAQRNAAKMAEKTAERTGEKAAEKVAERAAPVCVVQKSQESPEPSESPKSKEEKTHDGSTNVALSYGAGRITPELLTRRKPLAAQTIHELHLRDQGRCAHLDNHGKRCEQTRWLDRHHRRAVSQGGDNNIENLTTLCSLHHTLLHQASLES